MTLDVRTLGGAKAKRLFDVLLAARGAVVSRARLVDALWAEAPPRDAERSMDAYVNVLRNRIQPGAGPDESVIVQVGDGYRFDPGRATSAADDWQAAAVLV